MADDEDKLVTKPFKFVTGRCSLLWSFCAIDTNIYGSRLGLSVHSFIKIIRKQSLLYP